MRRLLASPFTILGVIFLSIGLLIRFGIDDATVITGEFRDTIKKYK